MKTISIACIASVLPLFASDMRSLRVDEVTIKSSRFGVEATLVSKRDESFSITVKIEEKSIAIPVGELTGITDARANGIHFVTGAPDGGPLPDDWLKNHGFIVSFDYGDDQWHQKDGDKDETMVFSRCHLHFSGDGKYLQLEKFIPLGNNKWRLLEKEIGKKGFDRGISESVECPAE